MGASGTGIGAREKGMRIAQAAHGSQEDAQDGCATEFLGLAVFYNVFVNYLD